MLIAAPTGSGKTPAAFLWALDRFVAEPPPDDPKKRRTRLVYVSPLKALGYDVQKNLRVPQGERRDMLRHPPDILITTPESLYLMLTSQARRCLKRQLAAVVYRSMLADNTIEGLTT